MKRKLIILCILLLILLISILSWWNQAIKSPDPSDKTIITFTIIRGEKIKVIADHLQKQGLIRSSLAFFILSRFGGLDDKIQAGEFRLNSAMDLITLSNTLTHGTADTQITIPEGWRNEEIAMMLTRQLDIPENEFLKLARVGYMFPDTYQIPKDASVNDITNILLSTFDKKVNPIIQPRLKDKKISLDEVVIIASLVEREAKYQEDRPLIASVILNRLDLKMKLDIDATVQYALGYQTKEKTWWKKELALEDLDIDSPYNTYKNNGLPPTPISNPGIAAIEAVLNAPSTEYLYYIADKSGKSHFAKNINEHNFNIAKYLNK